MLFENLSGASKFEDFRSIPNAEKLKRWRQCERVLRNMPEHERRNHWDMGNWGYTTPCGSIGCAAGHCGLDRWFVRQNFKFGHIDSGVVRRFFGPEGEEKIFSDYRPRSAEDVLEEVRDHIRRLGRQVAMSRAA